MKSNWFWVAICLLGALINLPFALEGHIISAISMSVCLASAGIISYTALIDRIMK